jgi:putative NADH-flavin reductase
MSIKNVCLLGANGNVGPMVLDALAKDGFNVTVLRRASSKSSSSYPSGVKVAEVDDAFAVDDLVPIFRGQDAVVVTIKGTQVDIQTLHSCRLRLVRFLESACARLRASVCQQD